jgi:hypothetical protein
MLVEAFALYLALLGYQSSYYDSSVYTLSSKTKRSIIWVHVDDSIVTGSSDTALKKLEEQRKGSLEIKWNKALTNMVGVNIRRTSAGFELNQATLIDSILHMKGDGTTFKTMPLPKGFNSNFANEDRG